MAVLTPCLPEPSQKADNGALTALIVGQLAVAASPILVRLTGQDPIDSAAGRMWIAVPILLAWSLIAPTPEKSRWSLKDIALVILAGVAFALDLAGMHAAIATGSVTNATFLVNLAPVLMVLAAWGLFGQRPSGRQAGALGIACLGGVALSFDTLGRGGADPMSDVYGVGSAIAFAAYMLIVQRLRARHASGPVMLWSSLACALTLAPMALADGKGFEMPATLGGLAALIALGSLVHAFGQGLTAVGLGRLSAAAVAPFLLLQPVATAVAVPFVVGEAVSLPQAVGCGLILASLALIRLKGRRG
ncbi:DMT family transporter [Lacibacterium aquatile]|uniref:DMT family transporter n=1 Tax=Lacibacterium aquatile TaxID=1168082 RepID=A0ABW5DMA1_9PROT